MLDLYNKKFKKKLHVNCLWYIAQWLISEPQNRVRPESVEARRLPNEEHISYVLPVIKVNCPVSMLERSLFGNGHMCCRCSPIWARYDSIACSIKVAVVGECVTVDQCPASFVQIHLTVYQKWQCSFDWFYPIFLRNAGVCMLLNVIAAFTREFLAVTQN
jgi:hypothetical protein